MPSLKDLRNRIASVKSTQKITKAMQMVAVSKLRRAQSAVEAARPYAERVETVLTNLAGSATEGQAPRLLVGSGPAKLIFSWSAPASAGSAGHSIRRSYGSQGTKRTLWPRRARRSRSSASARRVTISFVVPTRSKFWR